MRCRLNFKKIIAELYKKHRSKLRILLVFAVGLALLLSASGISRGAGEDEDDMTRSVREFCEAVDGVGECRVIISYEFSDGGYFSSSERERVMAVAVACRGADRADVQKKLKELLSSFFGIGTNRVSVLKLD